MFSIPAYCDPLIPDYFLSPPLGRELFIRRTHGYDLTDDGTRLLAELAPVEAVIARATLPAPDDRLPLVRVTAGT
ncbi:MAG: hypothetical protein ACK5LJ_14715 [Paracoccus sp. (in: a-proteobacteria)]